MSFSRPVHARISTEQAADHLAIRELRAFEATTHFNGRSSVSLGLNSATGVLTCLAHLVRLDGANRTVTTVCAPWTISRRSMVNGISNSERRSRIGLTLVRWLSARPNQSNANGMF